MCEKISNRKWVVELEHKVWLADRSGDPGRSCMAGGARRFNSERAARCALGRARRYRPFKDAMIYSPKGWRFRSRIKA